MDVSIFEGCGGLLVGAIGELKLALRFAVPAATSPTLYRRVFDAIDCRPAESFPVEWIVREQIKSRLIEGGGWPDP